MDQVVQAALLMYCLRMVTGSTKLSSAVTVARYRDLEQKEDRHALAQFFRDRFNERYFRPVESIPIVEKHGFMTMAVCCLVIETLESFYQGVADTQGKSKRLFDNFLARDTPLRVFASADSWFYTDIRCAILHQSETRRGWRIVRRGPLLDSAERCINATRLIRELRRAVDSYAKQLERDNEIWEMFKKKMKAVCNNCEY